MALESLIFAPLFAFLYCLTHSDEDNASFRILTCVYSVAITFLCSVCLLFQPTVLFSLGSWFSIGYLQIDFQFLFDPLTKIMLIVVSFVSFLVHLYSLDYMREDPDQALFMSYLSLFTFFMFVLVTSANFAILFVGWEGVGLSSYLLINFWYTRVNAQKSAIKAVIVNKVGDVLLMYAFASIFFGFQSLDYFTVFAVSPHITHALPIIDISCLFLLGGAAAKSAQLCLHTWLPDAMEGPTPVSALIHAATMVTAGIFLLVRCSPLLEFSEFTLFVTTILGSLTAFFAATVALCQHDIKRVIAYSTCSQLGYMMFAVGLSGYGFAMYHLFNHAFFKAALFLSAGSIIHSLANEQDLRRMGGTSKILPLAYVSTLWGSLSLMGFPFLSGFYSKDAILELAFSSSIGFFAFILGTASAFLTSLYSIRLLILAFINKPNGYRSHILTTHDAPLFMAIPLIMLFTPSIVSGYLTHDIFLNSNYFQNSIFVSPLHTSDFEFLPTSVKLTPTLFSFLGAFSAIFFFYLVPKFPVYRPIYLFLTHRWYFDAIINRVIVIPSLIFGRKVTYALDRGLLEIWGPTGISKAFSFTSNIHKFVQSGLIDEYVVFFLIGLLYLLQSIHNEFFFYQDLLIFLPLSFCLAHALTTFRINYEKA